MMKLDKKALLEQQEKKINKAAATYGSVAAGEVEDKGKCCEGCARSFIYFCATASATFRL